MTAESAITRGALRSIFVDGPDQVENPILQCVQIKAMDSKNGEERYRVVLSDMDNFIQSMLAQQINSVVTSGALKKGSIIRLKHFNPQVIKDRKILVVLDLDVLEQYGELDKLGQPKPLDSVLEVKREAQPAEIAGNNFYGNRPNGQLPTPATTTRTQSTSTAPSGLAHLYPIEALSPYAHKWTIKARCTFKSDIRTWHNKNGEGKLFSVNLLDESGEIRATGFKDQCDMLYDVFEKGQVYYVSNCSVKLAKKQFSNVNNDYELTFQNDSIVEKAEDTDVPDIRYNFTSIGNLQSVEPNTTIDTLGVLKEVGEASEIVSKSTGKPYSKRELTLVDDSMHSVRLTVWGKTAEEFDVTPNSVVAFKGVKVSDFGGRSLSLLSSGTMNINPDIDEAHKLKGWYDASGNSENFTTHQQSVGTTSKRQEYKTIAQVNDEKIGMMGDNAEYFTLKATIMYVKHETFAYPACASAGCNKKVVEVNPGEWRCEKCDVTHPRPEWRYIMQINVSDHTGQMWLSGFDESGRDIIGMSANELVEMKENEETTLRADKVFVDATCKTWVFRVRAKMDTFQDQERVRYQISSTRPLDFKSECAQLVETLKKYEINDSSSMFVN
ncbi:replication factor A 1, rfa1 [Phyllosticta citricarpa]|uniref:Replication protein A subunit n=2 Tax=Phyllosticta TaxID=121621 RepID=A0ABR1MLY2_9PEZI